MMSTPPWMSQVSMICLNSTREISTFHTTTVASSAEHSVAGARMIAGLYSPRPAR